jgi:protein-tyrosine phosphatase
MMGMPDFFKQYVVFLGSLDDDLAYTCRYRVKNAGIEAIHYPIPDKWIPASMEDVSGLVYAIINRLNAGKTVVVHWYVLSALSGEMTKTLMLFLSSNGGKGRTGLVVVSVLVALGMEPSEATDLVRLTRPGTLYNPAQQLYVRALRRFRDDQLNGRV